MTAYCSSCLDTWNIAPAKLDRGDFVNVAPGVRMHVTCGRALEAIRTAPATYSYGDGERSRWAAA